MPFVSSWFRSSEAQKTMSEKTHTWHKIADHINELDFQENNICVLQIGGKKICLGRHDGRLFAFAYKCPHAGGFLSDGYIDALGNVSCPVHRYKFSLANGRNVTGEGYYLKTWPVEEREEGLFVGLDAPKEGWNIFS